MSDPPRWMIPIFELVSDDLRLVLHDPLYFHIEISHLTVGQAGLRSSRWMIPIFELVSDDPRLIRDDPCLVRDDPLYFLIEISNLLEVLNNFQCF